MITKLLIIAIGSAFVNNVVLSQFLGLCPFLGVSKKVETAAGMGSAVIFVITLISKERFVSLSLKKASLLASIATTLASWSKNSLKYKYNFYDNYSHF